MGLLKGKEKLGAPPALLRWFREKVKESRRPPRSVKVMGKDGIIGRTTLCPTLRLLGALPMRDAIAVGKVLHGGLPARLPGSLGVVQGKKSWLFMPRNPEPVGACLVAR